MCSTSISASSGPGWPWHHWTAVRFCASDFGPQQLRRMAGALVAVTREVEPLGPLPNTIFPWPRCRLCRRMLRAQRAAAGACGGLRVGGARVGAGGYAVAQCSQGTACSVCRALWCHMSQNRSYKVGCKWREGGYGGGRGHEERHPRAGQERAWRLSDM